MNICELGDILDLILVIRRFPHQPLRYVAKFEDVETKENQRSGLLRSEYGEGKTPSEAIQQYAKQISGKVLVINAYHDDRREFNVPDNLEVLS